MLPAMLAPSQPGCGALGRVVVALGAAALAACAPLGVVDDGTSVSMGRANRGWILSPARLPDHGEGYRVPPRWSERGLRYGTDELVGLVIDVGRRVARAAPGARVTVGDLSWERGGSSRWHRSHQSGRDLDLCLFMTDLEGRPVELEVMRRVGPDGLTIDDRALKEPPLRLDVPRTWALVRALAEHVGAELQFLLLYEPLTQLLLDHARAAGEPVAVIERARALLRQPGDSAVHDDHLHVRLLCSAADRAYGCEDYGAVAPWARKADKPSGSWWASLPEPARLALVAPLSTVVALIAARPPG
jgi:penicillin-insensitive murein endopeptidase